MKGKFVDLTGMKIGKLFVVSRGENLNKAVRWICLCDCGKTTNRSSLCLTRKNKLEPSCGCVSYKFRSDRGKQFAKKCKTHGMAGTPEFKTWLRMRQRCGPGSNYKRNKHYKKRGTKVCERWQASFENFYADMGPRPSPKHSIDRIDNNGDYEPSNCRWADAFQQNRNRSNSRYFEYNGQSKTSAEWSLPLGGSEKLVVRRIEQLGWDVERAVTTPVSPNWGKRDRN